ncbi:hypothetical protein BU17DRAFT_102988 [Hysterangium stoloniferum]|nr:hypothetical protein BU17DRAFT_103987 [Hysterangium stoloniferum]KAF8498461.1 hypothetical protein BU17DRAFT_102988 [Hysterangium stoloniferum]
MSKQTLAFVDQAVPGHVECHDKTQRLISSDTFEVRSQSLMITLYDAASRPDSYRGWNPLPARIRYCLNFKGLSFKTVWLEYPDIESTLRSVGASPTMKWPDGRPCYTVPVIRDDSHLTDNGEPTVVSDSWAIAKYLDESYPDTGSARLLPDGTMALQMLSQAYIHNTLYLGCLARILAPHPMQLLSETSQKYYRETREMIFSTSLEDLCPRGSVQWKEGWSNTQQIFDTIATFLDQNGSRDEILFMGVRPSYVDFVLVSFLDTLAILLPDQWEIVKTWNGGRWAKLRESCAYWATIHD